MDERLKVYVVMKAVDAVNGKRGKSSILKLLKGSQGMSVVKTVEEFNLTDIWGVFYQIPTHEIDETISNLLNQGVLYTQQVRYGAHTYPMLFISEEGRSVLDDLERTEGQKIRDIKQRFASFKNALEVTEMGKQLERFMKHLISILNLWEVKRHQDIDLSNLMDECCIEPAEQQGIEIFLFHIAPEALKDKWRTPYALDQICRELQRDLRVFLGALPEMEAQIFRCHYQVRDILARPKDHILLYYGIPEKELPSLSKRTLNRFTNNIWYQRFSWISKIMNHISQGQFEDGIPKKDNLIKETATVTYELYTKGLSLNDIARERGLQVSTIYTHFAKLLTQVPIELDEIITQKRIQVIEKAIEEAPSQQLKEIKQLLPEDYTYGEIKLVLEKIKGRTVA